MAAVDGAQNPLNRNVELLPNLNHGCWQGFYNVMAIATFTLYVVAAVALTIFVGIIMPIYLPVSTVVIYQFQESAFAAHRYFKDLAEDQEKKAFIENNVAAKLATIPEDREGLIAYLRALNINANLIRDVEIVRLRPVIARFAFWRERSMRCSQQAEQTVSQAQPGDQNAHFSALNALEQAQLAKAHAAYYRGLILNPFIQDDIPAVFRYNPVPIPMRLVVDGLRARFGQAYRNDFLLYPTGLPRYTVEDLVPMTDEDLSRALFA